MKFRGIDTPEAARSLSGAELLVSRAEAAPLKANEFYIEDLRMLPVEYAGTIRGCIRDVIEGGGGNLVEVQLLSGEIKLVPLRDEFFSEIDIKAGKAVLANEWILA